MRQGVEVGGYAFLKGGLEGQFGGFLGSGGLFHGFYGTVCAGCPWRRSALTGSFYFDSYSQKAKAMNLMTAQNPPGNRYVVSQASSSAQMVRQMVRDEMRRGDFSHAAARVARIEELIQGRLLGRQDERELLLLAAQFLEAAGDTKSALRAAGQLLADEDTLTEELLVELRRFRTRLLLNIDRVEEARGEVDRIERVILSKDGLVGESIEAIDGDISRVTVPTWLLAAEVGLAEGRNEETVSALRQAFECMKQGGQSIEDGVMFELLSALCCYRGGDDAGIPAIAYLYRVHVVLESGVDAAVRSRVAAAAGDVERVTGLSRSEAVRWRSYGPDRAMVSKYLEGEGLVPPSELLLRIIPSDLIKEPISLITQVSRSSEGVTERLPIGVGGTRLSFEFSSYGLEEITSMLDYNMKTGPLMIDWSSCDKAVIDEAIAVGAISTAARECASGTIYFNNGAYVDAEFNGLAGEVTGKAVLDTIFELFRISMAGLPGACAYQQATGAMAARIPEIVNLRPNKVNIDLMRKLDHARSGVEETEEESIDRLFEQWEPHTAIVEETVAPRVEVSPDLAFVAKLGAVMEAEATEEIEAATRDALKALGYENPGIGFFVDGAAGSLGDSNGHEDWAVVDECKSGVVSVRFSLAKVTQAAHPEAVRVILNAAAQRLQSASGRAFAGRVDVADLVAEDPVTQSLLSTLRGYAALDGTRGPLRHICLIGERGTGKDELARLIHKWSSRAEEPYVTMNFGGVPKELAASLMFGAKKGSYSGCDSDRGGHVQEAGAGTLFLDELDEAPASLQALIKRVVQSGVFNVVGEASESRSKARFVAATNVVDLESLAIKKDLGDRFLPLRVPPLRERRGDIRPLAARFAKEHEVVLPEPVLAFLERVDWPGNVRQLRNAIAISCISAKQAGKLTLELVRGSTVEVGAIVRRGESSNDSQYLAVGETLETRLIEEEKRLIKHALESCGSNRTHAARLLGISRQSLITRIKRFELS